MFLYLQEEKQKIHAQREPTYYGWPDLNGLATAQHGESPEELRKKQEEAIKDCAENYVILEKDGKIIKPVMIPEMVEMMTDLFFVYEDQGILWKPRGGGGSLCAAILIIMCMLYKRMSFIDLAGSSDDTLVEGSRYRLDLISDENDAFMTLKLVQK